MEWFMIHLFILIDCTYLNFPKNKIIFYSLATLPGHQRQVLLNKLDRFENKKTNIYFNKCVSLTIEEFSCQNRFVEKKSYSENKFLEKNCL